MTKDNGVRYGRMTGYRPLDARQQIPKGVSVEAYRGAYDMEPSPELRSLQDRMNQCVEKTVSAMMEENETMVKIAVAVALHKLGATEITFTRSDVEQIAGWSIQTHEVGDQITLKIVPPTDENQADLPWTDTDRYRK